MVSKNTICLWYNGTALDAAKFYAETFPDVSKVNAVGAKTSGTRSWQMTPRALVAAIANPDRAVVQRAFAAMMQMKMTDVVAIEAAVRG